MPPTGLVEVSGAKEQQRDRQHRSRVQSLEAREEQLLRRALVEAIERPHDAGVLAEPGDKLLHGGRRGAAKDVFAEAVEKLVGAHHLPELHGQPMHEEPVRASAPLAALPYLLEPVLIGLEGRIPIVIVERLRWGVITFRLQEDGVLDEVEGTEARSASVECLEDDLGVVTLVEVDGDDIEEAFEAGLKRLDSVVLLADVSFSVVGDPLLDPVVKISPST